MISGKQIKAARALLSWSQKDLARFSGVSLATIAQMETGSGNPRVETLRILQLTFEKYLIAFTDDPGVKVASEPFEVTVWQGYSAMLNCWQDIEQTLVDGLDDITLIISCVDDELWMEKYPKEMLQMFKSRGDKGIVTLGLLTDASKNKSGWSMENYRIVPAEATSPLAPYYVYRDKVAIIKILDPIRIVLIKNPTLADSFRSQFHYHWNRGVKLK